MSKQYENLIAQVERLHRHNRQGSFRTRRRYYEAMQRLCRFLAEEYRLERLANLAPQAHLRLCRKTPTGRKIPFHHQN